MICLATLAAWIRAEAQETGVATSTRGIEASAPRPAGEGGRVRLEVELDAEGRVAQVAVIGRAPALVAAEAIRHASALRFAPTPREGGVERRRQLVVDVPPARASTSHPREPPLTPPPGTETDGVARPRVTATSEEEIEVAGLRDVPRFHAADLLTLLPGAVLERPGGEGAAPTVFFRGFDAGAGRDLEVLVEGMPINEPSNLYAHGHADLQFVIPELVDRLRARPGTFDVAQGDFALAGTVELRLGAERAGLRVTGAAGEYRRRRALLLWSSGREGRSSGADDFVAFEVQTGAGFGAHRAHWNVRSLARWGGGGERLGWSVLVGSHALAYESAGLLRQDAAEAACGDGIDALYVCAHDPTQGARASRHFMLLGAHHRAEGQRLDVRAWGQLRRHRVRENTTFRLFDPRGDALDLRTEGVGLGMRADYVAERSWRGATQALEVGLLTRHDRGEARALQLGWETTTPYAVAFDRTFALTHVGGHAGGTFQVGRVALRGGVRVAGFSFSTEDLMGIEEERAASTDGGAVAVLPRASLRIALWDAAASALAWTTSVGLGARPAESWARQDGERAPLTSARTVESGLRLFLRSWEPPAHVERTFRGFAFDGRLGTFWARVDPDPFFDLRSGRDVLVPATHRFGGFLQTRMVFEGWVELRGSLAWNEAHQVDDDASPLALARGPRVPFVPRWAGRYDVVLRREVRLARERAHLGVAVGGSVLGRRPLPSGAWSRPLSVLDASVRLGWRFLELELVAHNLFDARYRERELEYVSRLDDAPVDTSRPERHFAAGPPRQVMAVLSFAFDWRRSAADAPPATDETTSPSALTR
ncbi:MAG: TonB-dependent receptor plug domain-containing protein [Myxococcales bacterium]|nr:TonB-dependent receptor plug domain-containing protein [Myxococcales bacterium]